MGSHEASPRAKPNVAAVHEVRAPATSAYDPAPSDRMSSTAHSSGTYWALLLGAGGVLTFLSIAQVL